MLAKRIFSCLIIFTILIGCLFVTTGCEDNSVPLPEKFTLNADEISFKSIKETITLYDGPVAFGEINWGTNNPQVATFENGVVTATGPGTTEVFAEYFGVKHACFVDCSTLFYSSDLIPESALSTDYTGDAVLAPPKTFDGPSTFYNDAAFIGDSVSLKLSYYAEATGELGDALFLVAGSYGVGHAVDGTMEMYFQGKDTPPQDALAKAGVKKVFIMLGMNDLGKFGIDITMDYWDKFIANIREKNPDIMICIQSMTPVWVNGQTESLYNEAVDEYNERLKAFAKENRCSYMDIASFMKDADNGLATDYCSDNYVHLTDAGAYAWTSVLKAYAGQ